MIVEKKRPGEEARKKQILEAATKVFGEKNYFWASTKEIAETANMSERMIFFYFNSKKDLYREALRQAYQNVIEGTLRATPPASDIRAFVKMSERNFIDYLNNNPMAVKLVFQSIDAVGDPEIKKEVRATMQDMYELLYGILHEAQERGDFREDFFVGTAVIYILGFLIIVATSEFLDLDWFKGENQDVFTMGDIFADMITNRNLYEAISSDRHKPKRK
jgi:AcrR family transcriptional regulator